MAKKQSGKAGGLKNSRGRAMRVADMTPKEKGEARKRLLAHLEENLPVPPAVPFEVVLPVELQLTPVYVVDLPHGYVGLVCPHKYEQTSAGQWIRTIQGWRLIVKYPNGKLEAHSYPAENLQDMGLLLHSVARRLDAHGPSYL